MNASGYERGMKELCCAIIEQAVQDYKGLVASGKVAIWSPPSWR